MSKFLNSQLLLRSLSGIIYVAVIVGCVLLWGWCFTGLLITLMAVAVIEFHHLLDEPSTPLMQRWMIITMDLIGGLLIILFARLPLLLPIFLAYLALRPVTQLTASGQAMVRPLAISYASMLYIVVPLACLQVLASPWLVLALFIMIWVNDTGAFVVGSLMGKHKLCPSISPKKTWEGFIGGAIFVIGSAFIMVACNSVSHPVFFLSQLLPLAGVVIIFGTLGDLVESKIKRSLGVKDSGNIIPGHGGILDRIDSLLLVAPAAVLVFYLIQV